MKEILIIYLSFVWAVTSSGQGGWIQFLDSGTLGRNEIHSISYDDISSSLILAGSELDTFSNYLKIINIDTSGSVVKESIVTGDSDFNYATPAIQRLNKLSSGNYAIYGDLLFSGSRQFIYE